MLAGVSAKMIRHYESIGLIPEAARTFAGYRLYSDADVHRLQFIKRARTLGFSIKQIEALLSLWDDRSRASADVKRLAKAHAAELAQRIEEMQAMQRILETLEPDRTLFADRFRFGVLGFRFVATISEEKVGVHAGASGPEPPGAVEFGCPEERVVGDS